MLRSRVELLSVDKQITEQPTLVYGFWVMAGSSAKYADLHDGFSTDTPKIIRMSGTNSSIGTFVPIEPVLFKTGVYLNVESDQCIAMIQYRQLTEKEAAE